MRDGLFRLGQTRRDGAAHPVQRDLGIGAIGVHLHHSFRRHALRHARFRQGGGRRGRGRNRGWCRNSCRGLGPFDISAHDPAVGAGTGHLRQIQTLFRRQPARQGRGKNPRPRRLWGCRCRLRNRCGHRSNRRHRGRSQCRGRNRVGAVAVLQYHRDGGVHLDAGGSGGDQNPPDHAFIRGFKLHRGLVRLDLGKDLARFDHIPLFDQPFGQRALFHRGRQRRHQNLYSHVLSPLPVANGFDGRDDIRRGHQRQFLKVRGIGHRHILARAGHNRRVQMVKRALHDG